MLAHGGKWDLVSAFTSRALLLIIQECGAHWGYRKGNRLFWLVSLKQLEIRIRKLEETKISASLKENVATGKDTNNMGKFAFKIGSSRLPYLVTRWRMRLGFVSLANLPRAGKLSLQFFLKTLGFEPRRWGLCLCLLSLSTRLDEEERWYADFRSRMEFSFSFILDKSESLSCRPVFIIIIVFPP